jgi:hypothetical protein
MNTAAHYYLAGMNGLGASCAPGIAIAHAAVGGAMSTVGGALLMVPSVPTLIAGAVLEIGAAIQNFFFQPDCNKIATTQIVNQAEIFLKQNLGAWQALTPAEKTSQTQQAALMNFDNVWAQVVKACGSGQFASAGQACIADREQGACHYQNNGQCWNWFVGYRDPIANDPAVVANAAASPITSLLASTGLDPTLLLILAAAGLLAVVVVLS